MPYRYGLPYDPHEPDWRETVKEWVAALLFVAVTGGLMWGVVHACMWVAGVVLSVLSMAAG